jgi:asparagine synthase (glutamine-hydrolysing)
MGAVAGLIHWKEQMDEAAPKILQILAGYQSEKLHSWRGKDSFIACAHQWMTDESFGEALPLVYKERYVVAADAILDNRPDLFGRLNVHASRRGAMTDTMLLARAYEKWQEKLPYYVMGSYAAAVWDKKEEKLFLVRDSSGTRSLYYWKGKSGTAFSTTKEPLLQLPQVSRSMNEDWLAQFIVIPTMTEAVTMSDTVFQDIKQVPPSASITIRKDSIRSNPYTMLDLDYKVRLQSDAEYEEAFLAVLSESVRNKMRSSGKTGAHLSGGLDSGAVVSIAAKESAGPVHTYSMVPEAGFEDWTDRQFVPDESVFINATADYAGNVISQKMTFGGKHPLSRLDEQLKLMETPFKFIENLFWVQGIQEKAGEEGMKVLLNGARGNHSISWGSLALNYNYYISLMKKVKWKKLHKEMDAYCENFQTGKRIMYPFLAKKALWKQNKLDYTYLKWIHPELAEATAVYEKLEEYKFEMKHLKPNELSAYRQNYFIQNYRWNNSGVAGTKLSLKTGVWDRDPTDDPRVIQFCLGLPEEQYVKDGLERSIIRRATKNLLPDKVRLNMRRQGIQGADIIYRMRPVWSEVRSQFQNMVSEGRIADWVDMDLIRELVKNIPERPELSYAISEELRILNRCLVLHRFQYIYEGG